MLANRPNATAHAAGPCEAMRARAYESLQANSTPSPMGGPMRAFLSAGAPLAEEKMGPWKFTVEKP